MSPSVVVHMLQPHSHLPQVPSSQCLLEWPELLQQCLEAAVFELVGQDVSLALDGDLSVDGQDAGVVETHFLVPLQRNQTHEVILPLPVASHLPFFRLPLHTKDQLTRLDLVQRHEFDDCRGRSGVVGVRGGEVCPGDPSQCCFLASGYPGCGLTVVTAEGAEFVLEVDAFAVELEISPQQFGLIHLPALLQTVPPRPDAVKPFQELAARGVKGFLDVSGNGSEIGLRFPLSGGADGFETFLELAGILEGVGVWNLLGGGGGSGVALERLASGGSLQPHWQLFIMI